MVSLSKEVRQELLRTSRGAAQALAEDIPHLREVLARPDPSPAELRRVSAILRRLLVERDLSIVAAPRIGRIHLLAPDNKPAIKSGRQYLFFLSGGVDLFGTSTRPCMIESGDQTPLPDFDHSRRIAVQLDGFVSQPTLCLNGTWISRGAIIKYVANITSGVHSRMPEEEEERTLERIRSVVTFSRTSLGMANIHVDFDAINIGPKDFSYSETRIDPVLIELLSAIYFLVTSPKVLALEQFIRENRNA